MLLVYVSPLLNYSDLGPGLIFELEETLMTRVATGQGISPLSQGSLK